MKKFASFILSSIFLLSSTLTAQPGYPSHYSAPNMNSQTHSAPHIHWLNRYEDAVALSQSTSKPILILFTGTTWCPACMKLEREVLMRPEFAQAVGPHFVFLKAEFPEASEAAIAATPYKHLVDRYNITLFPTFVVAHANGQKLYTLNYLKGGPEMYARELLQRLQSANVPMHSSY